MTQHFSRIEGWEQRLDALIEAARHKPFQWGAQDCCSFACAAVQAVTGQDFYESFRGRIFSLRDAIEALQPFGGGALGVEGAFSAFAGPPQEGWTGAKRGDVVLLGRSVTGPGACWDGPALGVVDLSGLRVCAPGPQGLSFVPVKAAVKHWPI